MPFVLDSSVALAWLLPDESGSDVDALIERLEHDQAIVPAVWSLEVSNALRGGSVFSGRRIIGSLASNREEQDDEQEKTTPEIDGKV